MKFTKFSFFHLLLVHPAHATDCSASFFYKAHSYCLEEKDYLSLFKLLINTTDLVTQATKSLS